MLHLQGYDHERDAADARRMEKLETRILARLGFDPDAGRSSERRTSRPWT